VSVRNLARREAARSPRGSHGGVPDLVKRGWVVGVILAILTIGEYFIAVEIHENFIPLVVIALVKAVLIVWYFMHVYRIWGTEAH